MPLNFQPGPGTLWYCDFETGFVPPEMVKNRPVVHRFPGTAQPSDQETDGSC